MKWAPVTGARKLACKALTFTLIPLLAAIHSPAHSAPFYTGWFKLTALEGGWGVAAMALYTTGQFYNPESCPGTGYYTITPTDPGHELFQSMAISALMANREVAFVLDGCSSNVPRVLAIRVR